MNINNKTNENPDLITGEHGSHPVGTGAGAAAGGTAGAVMGVAGGPIGVAVGAVVGAVAGGIVGKAAAEAFNPTVEDTYWRGQFRNEPYYIASRGYEDYAPAYRLGYEAFDLYPGKHYDDLSSIIEKDYSAKRGSSHLAWEDAQRATRAAWNRRDFASRAQ